MTGSHRQSSRTACRALLTCGSAIAQGGPQCLDSFETLVLQCSRPGLPAPRPVGLNRPVTQIFHWFGCSPRAGRSRARVLVRLMSKSTRGARSSDVEAVPEIKQFANVKVQQITNVGSPASSSKICSRLLTPSMAFLQMTRALPGSWSPTVRAPWRRLLIF